MDQIWPLECARHRDLVAVKEVLRLQGPSDVESEVFDAEQVANEPINRAEDPLWECNLVHELDHVLAVVGNEVASEQIHGVGIYNGTIFQLLHVRVHLTFSILLCDKDGLR